MTLFPEMFSLLNFGVIGRALKKKLLLVDYFNPRHYTQNKHRYVDDRPYGGGPGMVMMVEPLQKAIHAAKACAPGAPVVIHLSPQGHPFTQAMAEDLLTKKNLILVASRYEGIDERLIPLEIDQEISIGDFVLSGGELAALTIIDTMTRLIPGALGHEESANIDSISSGLLKYPQYTRPDVFKDLPVPEVLLSGDHKKIKKWRLKQSLKKTWEKRPDLIMRKNLDNDQLALLLEFIEKNTDD